MRQKDRTIKYIIYILRLVALLGIVWYSDYSVYVKVLLGIVCGMYAVVMVLKKNIEVKRLFLGGLFSILAIIILDIEIKTYVPYRMSESHSYNISSRWSEIFTAFSQRSGYCDIIFPVLSKGKTFYFADEDSIYFNYLQYFAAKTVVDKKYSVAEEELKQKADAMLRIGIFCTVPHPERVFKEEIRDAISARVRTEGKTSVIYFSSAKVADENNLIVLDDSEYNFYIFTQDDFKAWRGMDEEEN